MTMAHSSFLERVPQWSLLGSDMANACLSLKPSTQSANRQAGRAAFGRIRGPANPANFHPAPAAKDAHPPATIHGDLEKTPC